MLYHESPSVSALESSKSTGTIDGHRRPIRWIASWALQQFRPLVLATHCLPHPTLPVHEHRLQPGRRPGTVGQKGRTVHVAHEHTGWLAHRWIRYEWAPADVPGSGPSAPILPTLGDVAY
uniref:Uncharacterized protein n=1 Tax=Anopheles coluzzii TaxID=1518534 RepID=A0A8W7PEJ9_ANOCL